MTAQEQGSRWPGGAASSLLLCGKHGTHGSMACKRRVIWTNMDYCSRLQACGRAQIIFGLAGLGGGVQVSGLTGGRSLAGT